MLKVLIAQGVEGFWDDYYVRVEGDVEGTEVPLLGLCNEDINLAIGQSYKQIALKNGAFMADEDIFFKDESDAKRVQEIIFYILNSRYKEVTMLEGVQDES